MYIICLVDVHMYIHITYHAHTCTDTYVYQHVNTDTYMHAHGHTDSCMYIHLHTCMCMYRRKHEHTVYVGYSTSAYVQLVKSFKYELEYLFTIRTSEVGMNFTREGGSDTPTRGSHANTTTDLKEDEIDKDY